MRSEPEQRALAQDVVFDVAVVGGGNAGMCAALTALGAGASVIVLESAPRELRGGNSRHTRNLRCAHAAPSDLLSGAYDDAEFFADLVRVSGETDEALARLVVRHSADCVAWLRSIGARFQSALRGTLHLGRTNAFFLGGGRALMNSEYAAAGRMGARILYDAEVVDVDIADGRFRAAEVRVGDQPQVVRARAVVLAAGGFEANLEWLREVWGPAADNFIIRGTPHNRGRVLKRLLDKGAQSVADARECHAVAVDARAPKFDGGIVTRVDSPSLGIVVNKHARRFYDEGEDFWPKRYAIWGRLIAQQDDQIAYAIVDAKALGGFIPSVFPAIVADTLPELAAKLQLPVEALTDTIAAFNAAVRPGHFDHTSLDDCRTAGLSPDKTHWARRIDTPPFSAYPLRPGITFTYLGLKVDDQARVVMAHGTPAENVFAAGEIMAGNVLRRGYVAGVGMTIGTVFGRIAGRGAAASATARRGA